MLSSNEEILKKIDPLHYFEQFILEEVYPDGRDTTQFRPTSIETSIDAGAYGSAYVQQGGACVSCAVRLTVAPLSDQPPVVYELKALECIPKLSLKEIVDKTNTHLARIIRDEFLLGPDALAVDGSEMDGKKFELRFTVHLEIVVISVDGSPLDAVLTAVQVALLDTRLPSVSYNGEMVLVDESGELDDIPLEFDIAKLRIQPLADDSVASRRLTLRDFLVSTSFLLYKSARAARTSECKLLCDASAELGAVIPSRCQVTVGNGEAVYALSFITADDILVDDATMTEIFKIARRRHAAISSAVERCQRTKVK